ncbi:Hcp family type VI secretion system effector [Paenibacillus lignilyticus]|uniref:Type VI secretion system tube protein Hcp n=1 Tax=Paenibacillus lignilyticus TaxID=1172615 RepID=A0ABS5CCX5_9BACL|nr:type VI secretion system tube protein Hcp [Paenibacillus lignilyticus]MBP3961777.1 type VI secretion system tube protein Hcp [Paenibacillus lignilyticus]MBP3963552.1 type VI secretion system tube protein Hcp [Paenibacillus lignilyticus]
MKKLLSSVLIACLWLATLSIVPASAAAPSNGSILLQLDGISGESTMKGYEKWIAIAGASFSITSQGAVAAGSGSGASKVSLSSLTISKSTDAASIPLMLTAMKGVHIPKGKLVYTRQGGEGNPLPYLMIELEDIFISNYNFDDTEETVELVYGKVKWTYWITDAKGIRKPVTGGWDVKKNVPAA